MLLDEDTVTQIIELVLSKTEDVHHEIGRFLVEEDLPLRSEGLNMWALRTNVRELMETTFSLEEFPEADIHVTYAHPTFVTDVIRFKEEVSFWQVSTVLRVFRGATIIYDPDGLIRSFKEAIERMTWPKRFIALKKRVALSLIEKSRHFIAEDMLADAYIWMVKAFEETISVPLMMENQFKLTSSPLLLETLRQANPKYLEWYQDLLQLDTFTPEKIDRARKELELLGDRLYHMYRGTDREMWILTSFVSINQSERRLHQAMNAQELNLDAEFVQSLYETAVVDLWQATFIMAQAPKKMVPLDPWVVGFFYNWFMESLDVNDLEKIIETRLSEFESLLEESFPSDVEDGGEQDISMLIFPEKFWFERESSEDDENEDETW